MSSTSRVVLLVDDHAGMRALIRTLFDLDRPDDDLVEAATAWRALDLWRQRRPDVILLDEVLGNERGLDAVAKPIRVEDPDIPIVLFTAFLDNDTREAAADLGIDHCVTQDEIRTLPDLVERLTASD